MVEIDLTEATVSSTGRSKPAAMFLGGSVAVVLPLSNALTVSPISYITDLFNVTIHSLLAGEQNGIF